MYNCTPKRRENSTDLAFDREKKCFRRYSKVNLNVRSTKVQPWTLSNYRYCLPADQVRAAPACDQFRSFIAVTASGLGPGVWKVPGYRSSFSIEIRRAAALVLFLKVQSSARGDNYSVSMHSNAEQIQKENYFFTSLKRTQIFANGMV